MIAVPDLAILTWLATRFSASPTEIGTACGMQPAEIRSRLVTLETMRLVSGRSQPGANPPQRVYAITNEGRRKAGVAIKPF